MKRKITAVFVTFQLAGVALAQSTTPIVNGQGRSREEALREAGRLATEAERTMGEALKKVRPGGDRKPVLESQRLAAESFEKAIELWRAAGDHKRLVAGIEELTRIYSLIGDYERVVDRLTNEADYWRNRGDFKQQTRTLFSLGIRQSQMKRESSTIETYERVVEMSRTAHLYSLGANALSQLAIVYDRVGRAKEAESCRSRAKEWWALKDPTAAKEVTSRVPATIPAQWVDLPSAPLAAEYRGVDGLNQAVLVNRSSKGVNGIAVGCVTLDSNNKARVVLDLIGIAITHGGIGPGFYFQPFSSLNGPLNQWTDEKMACEGLAKMALIEAHFEDGTKWKADGIDWVVR